MVGVYKEQFQRKNAAHPLGTAVYYFGIVLPTVKLMCYCIGLSSHETTGQNLVVVCGDGTVN